MVVCFQSFPVPVIFANYLGKECFVVVVVVVDGVVEDGLQSHAEIHPECARSMH